MSRLSLLGRHSERRRDRLRQQPQRRRQLLLEALEDRRVMATGLEPVVFVPGFGGSYAKDETAAGVREWLTNRGLAPNKLGLEPLGQV